MSRPDKKAHYDAVLSGNSLKQDLSIRLAAWSNFTAGYQVTLMPTDCPIIIKTKPTDPIGNLFASAEKWQPFAKRFFDLRPDGHACYLVDASGICSGAAQQLNQVSGAVPAAMMAAATPSAASIANATAGVELQEISKTNGLGEASRPIRNVISRLNPRLGTLIAAGGLPAILALKACVFSGFPCVADIVKRIVLFLPSAPKNWDKALLRGMKSAWESQAGTKMKKMAEVVVVVASPAERDLWSPTSSLQSQNPTLAAFLESAFNKVTVELLPAVGGNPLSLFANMLFKNPSSSGPVPLPGNRSVDMGIFEIRFLLSKYTKHVEQEVEALSFQNPNMMNFGNDGQKLLGDNDDDEEEEEQDEEEQKQREQEAKPAAVVSSSAVIQKITIQQQPYQLILSQLSQMFVKNTSALTSNDEDEEAEKEKKISVRIGGLVLDEEGNVGNAHGIVNITPASSLSSFVGKMVKFIADASFQEGKLILSSPRQILRIQGSEKETLNVVSSTSSIPPINHTSGVSRRYGCILMRGRKVALVRDSPSAKFMHFPSAVRKSVEESPIECASRSVCSLLDVLPDSLTILSDLPPVVTFEKVVNFLNPKDSETIVTTLYLAVTMQCPGGATRDGIEEELTPDDSYDWVTYDQAFDKLLERDEERVALKDASAMIRRAASDDVKLFSWPEGFGLLGDAARPVNDNVCAFVHTPFLDASAEEAAKALSSKFESILNVETEEGKAARIKLQLSSSSTTTNRQASNVLTNFLKSKVPEASSVAKHVSKSSSHITFVPLNPSVTYATSVFDMAPSVKRKNWAESRQVTILTPSSRVLSAFDGSEEDVDVVAVAEDVLEHSDEIIILKKNNNNSSKNNDDDTNDEEEEISKILLALLHARKNGATAVWIATTTNDNNHQVDIDIESSQRILSSWIRPATSPRDPGPRWNHPSVVLVRPHQLLPENQQQKPLNPILLSQLASEESVELIRKMNLVHVKGSAWVAGCQTHPVRICLRGGSDWSFTKAVTPFFTSSPSHDLELVFCPVSKNRQGDAIREEAKKFFVSLLCKDGDVFMNESELDILPGFAVHDHEDEEEEEDEGDE